MRNLGTWIACVAFLTASSLPAQNVGEPGHRVLVEFPHPVKQMAIDAKARTLAVALSDTNCIIAWNVAEEEQLWQATKIVDCLDIGDDVVMYAGLGVNVHQLELDSGAEGDSGGAPTANQRPTCMVADPKGRWALIGSDEGTVTRITPPRGWSFTTLGNAGCVCMALDPKAAMAAVGGQDGSIRFVNAKNGKHEDDMGIEGKSPITALVFVGSGKALAAGAADGSLRVFHVAKGVVDQELRADNGPAVTCMAAGPKGRRMAVGDEGGRVAIWDLKEGAEQHSVELTGEGPVTDVLLLAKGTVLLASRGTKISRVELGK